jgi:hypothetical protein
MDSRTGRGKADPPAKCAALHDCRCCGRILRHEYQTDLRQDAPLPWTCPIARHSTPSRQCRLRRQLQVCDQPQDLGEQVPRHGDPSQLEGNIAVVADGPSAHLDRLLLQAPQWRVRRSEFRFEQRARRKRGSPGNPSQSRQCKTSGCRTASGPYAELNSLTAAPPSGPRARSPGYFAGQKVGNVCCQIGSLPSFGLIRIRLRDRAARSGLNDQPAAPLGVPPVGNDLHAHQIHYAVQTC